jgi:chorismate mutase
MPVSQMALNLHFDGLMIESHCNPECAWSDASQQLLPDVVKKMTEDLYLRKGSADGETAVQLSALRQQIDEIDNQIISILGARMNVAQQIGEVKKAANLAILQNTRWKDVLAKTVADGQKQNLSEVFVRAVFEAIHTESIERQNAVMNADEK